MRKEHPDDPDFRPELPDDLNAFANRLASFQPKSVAADHGELMFAAGRAAARLEYQTAATASRRRLRIWQSAAIMLASLTTGFVTAIVLRPEPDPRVVILERESSPIQDNERPDQSPNALERDAVVLTPATDQALSRVESTAKGSPDLFVSVSNVIAAIRTRQSVINQVIDANSESNRTVSAMDSSTLSTQWEHRKPVLTPRSMMFSDKKRPRSWINRLIEEPQL